MEKYKNPEERAMYQINIIIYKKVDSIFVPEVDLKIHDDSIPQSDEELLSLAYYQQRKIVSSPKMRRTIYPKLNTDKLQIWNNILEECKKQFESIAISNKITFGNFYMTTKSVVTPKTMEFDDLMNFLHSHFGNDLFPQFSYEDAAVIIFIKPIYPAWIYRQFPSYKKNISRYINYLSFALKKVIEVVNEVEINIYIQKSGIKTHSAAQNILLYLSNKLKMD